MKFKDWLLVFCLLCAWFSAPAYADYFSDEDPGLGPLHGRNQAPILYFFYIMPAARAQTLGKGKVEASIDYDISNTIFQGNTNSTIFAYDLETHRTSFHLSYGVLDSLDLHLEIPFMDFDDGFLDGFLGGYHEKLNLPAKDRESAFEDQFAYFAIHGNQGVAYQPLGFTLGDINLDLKWQVLKDESWWPGISLRSGVKFPSGDIQDGSGSGEFDYAFGFTLSKAIHRLHFFAGMEGVIIRVPQPLRTLVVDDHVIHWFVGTEFVLIKEYLSFLLQVDGQSTPFAATGLTTFDKPVLEIFPGFKGELLDRHVFWQAGLREDLISYSTVDFTASVNLGARF